MKRRMIQLGRYGVCYFFMLCSIGCSRLSDQLKAEKRKHTAFTAASSNAANRSGRQRDSNRTAIFTWGTFLRVLMLGSVLQPAGPTSTYGQNSIRDLNLQSDAVALEELKQLFMREQIILGKDGKNLNIALSYINMKKEFIKAEENLQYCESDQRQECKISLSDYTYTIYKTVKPTCPKGQSCLSSSATATPSTTPCPQPIPCPSSISYPLPKNCSQEVANVIQNQSNLTVPKDLYSRLYNEHKDCLTDKGSLLTNQTTLNTTIQNKDKKIESLQKKKRMVKRKFNKN